MRVLLDENLPQKLTHLFDAHLEVRTTAECGWKGAKNGALLRLAETRFDVFITVDQGIPHEQNLGAFALGIVLLETRSNRYDDLSPLMPDVNDAIRRIRPGELIRVSG